MQRENYKKRLVDDKLERYLKTFGAVCIEGPKWCGKTWTGEYHSKSVTYLTEKDIRNLAKVNPKYIFLEENPQLIDEWQLSPNIWDSVRHECDADSQKGKFILTGSTSLLKEDDEDEVFHSGAGRIATLKMYPMSLYESGNSTKIISIQDMINGVDIAKSVKKNDLPEIAEFLIKGGWPANIDTDKEDIGLIPKQYIQSILKKDIHERKDKKRDELKMEMLLKSLARNETTIAGIKTIVKDIEEYETGEDILKSRTTVDDYLDVLSNLYLIENQSAFDLNYRSSKRVGKTPKRHFVDPSLACALLNLSVDKLLLDHNTFGFLFEALVERDLRIYMDYLGGHLYHFRDNQSNDEVDAILEFEDGEYAAIEIKLTYNLEQEAVESLEKFYENVKKKPKFMAIIFGEYGAVCKNGNPAIYKLPVTALKPR